MRFNSLGRESTKPEFVVAFFASWRLGEKPKKTATTDNAIAKEIVDSDQFPRAADLVI
jgi:hypothetical protein